MKNCKNCNEEVEIGFEICWNCNYSFTENKVIEIKDYNNNERDISCLRCTVPMIYSGVYKFHEGPSPVGLGSLSMLFLNRESFELYICKKCGKVEFFAPLNNGEIKSKDNMFDVL